MTYNSPSPAHPVLLSSPAIANATRFYRPALVGIDRKSLSGHVASLKKTPFRPEIDTSHEFGSQEKFFIPYFLVLNAVNFRFWEVKDGLVRRYAAWGAAGSVAMARGMSLFFHHMDPLWRHDQMDPLTVERLAMENFDSCFPGIPDRDFRFEMLMDVISQPERLHAASRILTRRAFHYGYFSPLDILLLMESFPLAYGQDEFCKRAQLALMMVSERYRFYGRGIALRGFSVAADYQIPKVLRAMGILVYSPRLAEKVDSGCPILPRSEEERAIRSATIIACDRLLKQTGSHVAQLDYWLWSKRDEFADHRFHLTETRDY